MESKLLKESWAFPRTRANSSKEEDTAASSAWKEDFQDLSSWCMDTFQAQCDFRIGESTTFKLSGMKYEDNGISTVEEDEILKGLRSKTDDEKWGVKMDIVEMTAGESSDNYHHLLPPPELINKFKKEYDNEENYASSSWLMSPESTASTSTSSSKKHNTIDVSAPFQSEYQVSNDCACSTNETWDELPPIEAIESGSFDLLSYLCDDVLEIHSEGNVSTDSSAKHRPVTVSSPIVAPISTKVKIEETDETPKRRRMETRASSTVTSSPAEIPATSFRRSERTRSFANNKEKEKIIVKAKKDKNEKKGRYERDPVKNVVLIQYRESREKNNEASRKSRMNKKAKESEMSVRATQLEKDNKILKMKVEELEKLVMAMRSALLQSALRKEF